MEGPRVFPQRHHTCLLVSSEAPPALLIVSEDPPTTRTALFMPSTSRRKAEIIQASFVSRAYALHTEQIKELQGTKTRNWTDFSSGQFF